MAFPLNRLSAPLGVRNAVLYARARGVKAVARRRSPVRLVPPGDPAPGLTPGTPGGIVRAGRSRARGLPLPLPPAPCVHPPLRQDAARIPSPAPPRPRPPPTGI